MVISFFAASPEVLVHNSVNFADLGFNWVIMLSFSFRVVDFELLKIRLRFRIELCLLQIDEKTATLFHVN